MHQAPREPSTLDEAHALRRSVRDLVALTALPSLWIGQPLERILETLADALLSTLRLEVAHVRAGPAPGSTPLSARRLARPFDGPRVARAVERALDRWDAGADETAWMVPGADGAAEVRLVLWPIGADGGVLAAGSARPGFPSDHERLLLRVAANQAAIAMQGARLMLEREHARAEAEAAVRARDEFLSIASHELKTPVAGIKASAQLARRALAAGRLDEARLARTLDLIESAADRLGTLTNDLLDVSRLRLGEMPVRAVEMDLAALIRDAAARCRERWDDRPIAVEAPVASPVTADPDRLDQVLTNLLENAAKYSPAGGTIAVTLEAGDEAVRVCVRDEGIGLPSGEEERIFEPFGRAANAVEQHLPGMGLGLYICRRIAEQHGGRIWAESPGVGRGTTFLLEIPRRVHQEAPAER